MATRLYSVVVEGIGLVQVSRLSIDEPRAWAAKAFGKNATKVSPVVANRRTCIACESRPCCRRKGVARG